MQDFAETQTRRSAAADRVRPWRADSITARQHRSELAGLFAANAVRSIRFGLSSMDQSDSTCHGARKHGVLIEQADGTQQLAIVLGRMLEAARFVGLQTSDDVQFDAVSPATVRYGLSQPAAGCGLRPVIRPAGKAA